MTKPRTNPDRQLFGVIGVINDVSTLRSEWNTWFEAEGIDAFMGYYPTKEAELPDRLSEMFHFDRRGYIVGKALGKAIIPLLDHLDSTAVEEGSVDTVVNDGGVFTGYFLQTDTQKLQQVWFS